MRSTARSSVFTETIQHAQVVTLYSFIAPPLKSYSLQMSGKFSPLVKRRAKMSSKKPSKVSTAQSTSCTLSSVTDFVILGSGVSTGIPRISCVIREPDGCEVCRVANENPRDKNRRCNVSALVRANGKTVLIDIGKTTREAVMRQFGALGISSVDAIVLTHGHADAVLGLDDCRDIQHGSVEEIVNGKSVWIPPDPMPVYLNEETMLVCQRAFPYLVPEDQRIGAKCVEKEENDIPRRVAAIKWKVYPESEYFKPFYPTDDKSIEFVPFPMLHGGTYVCMGFLIRIGEKGKTVAYLSDLHALPEKSLAFLEKVPRIDLLVVDMLARSEKNKSHFNFDQSIAMVRKLRPVKAVAVGMTCSLGLHDEVNKELAALDSDTFNFRLAYDGMRFDME